MSIDQAGSPGMKCDFSYGALLQRAVLKETVIDEAESSTAIAISFSTTLIPWKQYNAKSWTTLALGHLLPTRS